MVYMGPLSTGTYQLSTVTDMNRMFFYAPSFNSEISKWDVSKVSNMKRMFFYATSFNGDLSEWDVSSVRDMSSMFYEATSFKQELCGAAWARSKASMTHMFGSLPQKVCTPTASHITPCGTRSQDESSSHHCSSC